MKIKTEKMPVSGLEIMVVKSLEEIEKIRPVWQEMQCNQSRPLPNADIDRYLPVLEPINDVVQPWIILLHQNGCPKAMLIGQKGETHMQCKMGYLTFFKPSLRCIWIIYGGLLGQPKPEVCSILVEELNRALRNGEADVVAFNHLSTDSEIYQLVRTMPNILCRSRFPKVDPHWSMSVPEHIDLFYKRLSTKHRSNLRRYIRKLESEHDVRVITYSREDRLEEAIAAATQISSHTYQRGLSGGFVDDARMRSYLATAARYGWLQLHILFIDDNPCAFQLGLQYGEAYFLEQMGFHPKWKKWSVGTTLFLKVLEEICKDPTVNFLDFGFGDAKYKRSYGDQLWLEATVYIFAPRLYPMWVNTLQSSMAGLSQGMSSLASKIGIERWVKRRWRNLLQRGNSKSKT